MENNNQRVDPRLVRIGIIGLFIAIIVLVLGVALAKIFHRNPYGDEIKIDNFSEYYKNVPSDRQDRLYAGLYSIAASNTEDTTLIPKAGAKVRGDTARTIFDEETRVYFGTFIVDIAELEQSYAVQFEWTTNNKSVNYSGDSMLITCVSPSEAIYKNFNCQDMFTEQEKEDKELFAAYPIMKDLPIHIEYYVNGYGKYIRYDIESDLSYVDGEYSFKVIITDYSGDNFEAALKRITDLGYKLEDYEFEYIDESNWYEPAVQDEDVYYEF